ncbi:MAG: hypothetical protein JWN07_1737 [Hyphomicrobiales bacterium]|nr:hypothetical protein [Hyphomicrobiales bacterium]
MPRVWRKFTVAERRRLVGDPPADARRVFATSTGYVQHIVMATLRGCDRDIFLKRCPAPSRIRTPVAMEQLRLQKACSALATADPGSLSQGAMQPRRWNEPNPLTLEEEKRAVREVRPGDGRRDASAADTLPQQTMAQI